jgi:hypothetical protein
MMARTVHGGVALRKCRRDSDRSSTPARLDTPSACLSAINL